MAKSGLWTRGYHGLPSAKVAQCLIVEVVGSAEAAQNVDACRLERAGDERRRGRAVLTEDIQAPTFELRKLRITEFPASPQVHTLQLHNCEVATRSA
jgi:hypothetical protein